MKNVKLLLFTVLVALLNGCSKDDSPIQRYSAEDLLGTWLYVLEDNTPLTSGKVAEETFYTDGTVTYRYVEEDKWVERTSTYTVDDDIIFIFRDNQEHQFEIINIDKVSMVIRSKETEVVSTAQFVHTTENAQIYGTWICDEFSTESIILKDYQVTFGENGEYIVSYEGGDSVIGNYKVLNNCFLYQSNRAGAMMLEMSQDEQGMVLNQIYVDHDGTAHVNVSHRKPMSTFTLADAEGIWLTTSKDGEPIDLQDASICVGDNQGNSVISYIENGTWTEHNVKLSAKDNVVTRVIDGQTDSYKILYFDKNSIIWKSNQDGSVVTRTKILPKDDLKEYVKGMWKNDNASLLFKEDSLRLTFTQETRNAKYKLYGDILVDFTDTDCLLFRFFSGYDNEAGRPTLNVVSKDDNGEIRTYTYLKVDLLADISGGWIWLKKNGEDMPTSEFELSYFNTKSMQHEYQTFVGEYTHIFQPFTISKGRVSFPEDTEFPYFDVKTISENEITVIASDNNQYQAFRVTYPNPLQNDIIGEWKCETFSNEQYGTTQNVTHIFDSNGYVTILKDGDQLISGTYKIYDRLIVMLLNESDGQITSVLWIIKNGVIEDNSMTLHFMSSNGTIIENILTKVVK